MENDEIKALREHRMLKDARYKLHVCELQLAAEVERRSHLEAILREAISKRYFNEHRATPAWLASLQAAFPPILGERR